MATDLQKTRWYMICSLKLKENYCSRETTTPEGVIKETTIGNYIFKICNILHEHKDQDAKTSWESILLL